MIIEHGKKVIYVLVLRSIFGMIKIALHLCELYIRTLKNIGFKLNSYDKFMGNKMTNSFECTVGWFVYDNKISHMDNSVNIIIVDIVWNKFGNDRRNKSLNDKML